MTSIPLSPPSFRALLPILTRALALALALVMTPAFAGTPLVDARMTVLRIESNGASETAGPASSARPGDVLEYAARYDNRGDALATDLQPVMPIPAGTEYVPSNAAPKPTHASLDGSHFEPIPLRRKESTPDGARWVDVPLAEYRALRWTLGTLAAGGAVTVRARVRVAVQLAAAQ